MAGTGPMPNRSGSTPAVANATKRAERRDAERACPFGGHDDDRGGTVARLRGIPGGHRARDVKRRLQFRECGDRSIAAWAFVDVERDGLRARSVRGEAHFERDDLVRKSPGIDGGDGLLMAGERERVLFLAAHGRFAGVILGDEARGQVDVRIGVDEDRVGRNLVSAHRHEAHRLGAAGDDDVGEPGHDALGAVGDRLEAGGAEAIDGDRRRRDRDAGAQAGDSRDVQSLLGLRHGAAEDDVFDLGGVETGRARQRFSDHRRCHLVWPRVSERPAWRLAAGRADSRNDDRVFHA